MSERPTLAAFTLLASMSALVMPARAEHAALSDGARLHQSVLTLDSHIDIPANLHRSHERGPMQFDLPKMRDGGLDAGAFVVFVKQGALTEEGYASAHAAALKKLAAIEMQNRNNQHQIKLATTPAELRAAVDAGYLVAMVGLENAYSLGRNLEHLGEFHRRGVSYVSLTHVGHNEFALSSNNTASTPVILPVDGLYARGRSLIQQLNRLGIMVDVSHAAPEAVISAVALSTAPVIASHSAIRSLCDHPRNLSDRELQAIADRGGVVQIVAYDEFLAPFPAEKKHRRDALIAAALKRWDEGVERTIAEASRLRADIDALNTQWPPATVADLVDHIEYAVDLLGIEHVGIASDFGGGGGLRGWSDASESANVTLALQHRGFSADAIAKLWSGNYLRVWQAALDASEAEQLRARLSSTW